MAAILKKKNKANTGIDRDSLVFHLQGIHLRDDICGEASCADWSCRVAISQQTQYICIKFIHIYTTSVQRLLCEAGSTLHKSYTNDLRLLGFIYIISENFLSTFCNFVAFLYLCTIGRQGSFRQCCFTPR